MDNKICRYCNGEGWVQGENCGETCPVCGDFELENDPYFEENVKLTEKVYRLENRIKELERELEKAYNGSF